MSTRLTTVEPEETIGNATELLLYGGIRHLPVVKDGELIGVVSERDMLPERVTAAFPALRDCPVADVMASPVETTNADDDVSTAAARMVELGISSLPVVVGNTLVGILTSTDILAERGMSEALPADKVSDPAETVMQTKLTTVSPDDEIREAVRIMLREKVREVPVIDESNRVLGMLSDRDLRQMLGDPISVVKGEVEVERVTVGDVMRAEPQCVQANASLTAIARCFLDERVGVVPVVDSAGCLMGKVTYLDLFQHLLDRSDES